MSRKSDAVNYCSKYVARYTLGSAVVASLMIYLVWRLSSSARMPMSSVLDGSSGMVLKWMLTVIPVGILSFLVGWSHPGTKNRLICRILLNTVLATLLLYAGISSSYGAESIGQDGVFELTDLMISMGAMPVALFLSIIPVCSVVDAVLEYRESRDEVA